MNISENTKKKIYLTVIAVAVLAMIGLGIDYRINKKKSAEDVSFDNTATVEKDEENKVLVSVSTETIREGLSDMGTLITQEYYFTQVEKYTKEKTIMKFINTSSEFLYSYDGAVTAGIDFTKIEIKKDEEQKKLTVVIPKSEILSVNIDKDTFKIYSEKDSLWNPLKLEDYNISLTEFETVAKQKALESGILDRSDEQAKTLVSNFISEFPAAKGYEIVFDQAMDLD